MKKEHFVDNVDWEQLDDNTFQSFGLTTKKEWVLEFSETRVKFTSYRKPKFIHLTEEEKAEVKDLPRTSYGYVENTMIHSEEIPFSEFTSEKLALLQTKS